MVDVINNCMDYSKHYTILIERAKNRTLDGYTERHHIVPRCLGGNNKKENMVALTAREHYVAHQLLVKMNPGHGGLVKGAAMMANAKSLQVKRMNNRLYEWLRIKHSKVMSESQSGKGNSQFGTMWITNGTQARKIIKQDAIPAGWVKGGLKRPPTPKQCKKCGQIKCQLPATCSKTQQVKSFIKHLDFDQSTLGTQKFYSEYDRIIKKLQDEYNSGDSIEDIKNKYKFKHNETVRCMFRRLGIKRRSSKDALLNFHSE